MIKKDEIENPIWTISVEALSFEPVSFDNKNPYNSLPTLRKNFDKLHKIIYSDEIIDMSCIQKDEYGSVLYDNLWDNYRSIKELFSILHKAKEPSVKHNLVNLITIYENKIYLWVASILKEYEQLHNKDE